MRLLYASSASDAFKCSLDPDVLPVNGASVLFSSSTASGANLTDEERGKTMDQKQEHDHKSISAYWYERASKSLSVTTVRTAAFELLYCGIEFVNARIRGAVRCLLLLEGGRGKRQNYVKHSARKLGHRRGHCPLLNALMERLLNAGKVDCLHHSCG